MDTVIGKKLNITTMEELQLVIYTDATLTTRIKNGARVVKF